MKVLITHERYLPEFGGGGESIVHETALGLKRQGFEVTVVTTGRREIREYGGTPTLRLPIHRYRFNLAVLTIARQARDADLIQTFTYHACLPSLIAGKLTSKPVVCLCLGLFGETWSALRGPFLGKAWQAWERFLLTRPFSRVVFLSEFSRRAGIGLGVPEDRSAISRPGVDARSFDSSRPKEDAVLFVGKLEARKGIDIVLDVARVLPQVRFRIAGWGPAESVLRREAPPNVTFLGYLHGRELRNAYERARIFFFPSRAETFGLVITEAMAAGCTVVSTVPLDYEGACVTVGDRCRMIETIARLWNDADQCRRMGQRNAELARSFTWERFSSELSEIYRDVCRVRSPVVGFGTRSGRGAPL